MCLILQGTRVQVQVLKPCKSVQEFASKDDDWDASSTDKMSTWYSYPLSLITKRGSSFGYESSLS